jgi:hypothetical protein
VTAKTESRVEIDIVSLLTQLLARQVSRLVSETADELERLTNGKTDALRWEASLYKGLGKNCAEKAKLAKSFVED